MVIDTQMLAPYCLTNSELPTLRLIRLPAVRPQVNGDVHYMERVVLEI